MKKSLALILAALMVIGCFSMIAVSAATGTVILVDNKYVDGQGYKKTETKYEPTVGATATYTCSIQCPKTIEDGQFLLMYDNSVLKVTEVQVPNIADAVYNPDFSDTEHAETYLTDRVKVNFSRYKGLDFTTEKVLFTVKFSVISEGEGKIELITDPSTKVESENKSSEQIIISDTDDNDVLSITTINQKLEINDEPATDSEPTTPSSSTEATESTGVTTDTSSTEETATAPQSETVTVDPSESTTPSETVTESPSSTQQPEPSETSETSGTQPTAQTEPTGATQTTEPTETSASEPVTEEPTKATQPVTAAPTTAPKPTSAPKVTTLGGTPSVESADAFVKALKNDKDPKGSSFALLKAKASKVSSSAVKVKWAKVKGAKGYIIYGNKCGKSYKLIKKTSSTSFTQKKLKKGTYYKYLVLAYNSKNKVIATSKTIHAATKGGKVGNAKSVKFTNVKSKYSIKKNKTFKLKTKVTPQSKKLKIKNHRKVAFESSNAKVIKVNSKGKIKGLKKGSAYIYAYAQNGVATKVKITVK